MDKKKICGIVTLVIGVLTLVGGVVFLVIKLNQSPAVDDGEYLVSVGKWTLDDGSNCVDVTETETQTIEVDGGEESINLEATDSETNCTSRGGVVWQFTEIGKGTLTTNNHVNDYDFKWALEDERLIIQTDWLYKLDNEYTYVLDQGAGTLVLSDGEKEYKFVAQTE